MNELRGSEDLVGRALYALEQLENEIGDVTIGRPAVHFSKAVMSRTELNRRSGFAYLSEYIGLLMLWLEELGYTWVEVHDLNRKTPFTYHLVRREGAVDGGTNPTRYAGDRTAEG
jgi:hypothetical protein